MIFKGKDTHFEFVIAPGEGTIPSFLDVAVTAPEDVGAYSYHKKGADFNAVYVPPIPSNNPVIEDIMGSFKFIMNFTDAGLWIIELDTGVPDIHSIIHTELVFVAEHDAAISPIVFLP